MNFPRTWLLVACFTCFQAFAQSGPQSPPTPTNSVIPVPVPGTNAASAQPGFQGDLSAETQGQAGAGAVQPPKPAKKFWRAPLRLVKDLNPFAPLEPRPPLPVPRNGGPTVGVGENRAKGDYSPRAWTTTVGWNPGQSAFPDPITAWP